MIGIWASPNTSQTRKLPLTGSVGAPWPARSPVWNDVSGLSSSDSRRYSTPALIATPSSAHGVLTPAFAEQAREVQVADLLGRDALDDAEDIQVIDRGGRRGRTERIVRDAGRVGAVEHRAADDRRTRRADRNDRAARVDVHGVQRTVQTSDRELVLVDLRVVRAAILEVGVVRADVRQVAARAEHAAPALVTEVGDTRAAFRVAAKQLEEGLVVGVAARIEEVDRRRTGPGPSSVVERRASAPPGSCRGSRRSDSPDCRRCACELLRCGDISGLSQLMVSVLPKSPDGAICANVRSSMNMNSRYGLNAGLIS